MKTLEVLERVLAGKRMSESSRANFRAVFGSLAKMYEEFPTRGAEVNEWLVSLDAYSDRTVRMWFGLLKSACNYMEGNFELVNPCKAVDSPKVKKQRRRYHKAEDIMKIIGACKTAYDTALIMALVDSSCRVGGLAGLTGGAVGDGFIDVIEKTGARRYRLEGRLCEVLRNMAGSPDNSVFGLSASAISMRVIRISRRAGLTGDKLGSHTLRHSSATLVAEATKNVLAVKALLQHDSIQTSNLYIHDVEEEVLKGAVSPMKLIEEKLRESGKFGGRKQLPLEASSGRGEAEVVDVIEDEAFNTMVGDMFPGIKQGVSVHTTLKALDLELIRRGFIELARVEPFSADIGNARLLMKRMLRKVKGA